MRRNRGGFTVVEIMVAVVVLSIGVIALVGSSGMVTRMMGRGKISTFAIQRGEQRLEQLRAAAAATDPPCSSVNFVGGTSAADTMKISEKWIVSTGSTRTVTDSVSYRVPGGTRTLVVSTLISCF